MKGIFVDDDFVYVPAGEYVMGSPTSEEGRHRGSVEREHACVLAAFWMLKTPVTFAQYDQYCDLEDLEKPDDCGWGRANRPVVNVSYAEATDFCFWLTDVTGVFHRLPTEAEWEYTCRSGTTSSYSTGVNISREQANFSGNDLGEYPDDGSPSDVTQDRTVPVGSFLPNPWGLYDMHGNVWEWCASEYAEEYAGQELLDASVIFNVTNRVLRGGSWLNEKNRLRSASRSYAGSLDSAESIGFRVVQVR